MNDFTGRRPNDAAKRFGKSLLNGLSYLGTVMADGPKLERIEEIDQLLIDLKQERDHLINALIEPGDLKVSDDYNPHWTKPSTIVTTSTRDGRLTQCKGRFTRTSTFSDEHPGCPYSGTVHNAHEFTLRD
jgi:hypothetical protein